MAIFRHGRLLLPCFSVVLRSLKHGKLNRHSFPAAKESLEKKNTFKLYVYIGTGQVKK